MQGILFTESGMMRSGYFSGQRHVTYDDVFFPGVTFVVDIGIDISMFPDARLEMTSICSGGQYLVDL
uniref:Uncharacterized protein n=1 Tax=mine drainage metagenome TaxID=410659 RepID=E6QDF8_9ZZZZ